jgi:glycosyltransferase involved in cell wall biosynthesis
MKQKDIISIVQHNRGTWQCKPIERRSWGYFMNLGFKCAQGKYVCMLSDDCLVVPGAVINGYNHFEDELKKGHKVGAVAFYWRNWPEQKKYWVGLTFGNKMFVNHGIYLKSALEEVGYIDEEKYLFYHADSDICLRMSRNGYICIESPNSYIEHYRHTNVKGPDNKPDWDRFVKTWGELFKVPDRDWIEKEHVDLHHTVKQFKKKWFI